MQRSCLSLFALFLGACSSSGSGTPELRLLPRVDPDPGLAQHAVLTENGVIFASFVDGTVLRLGAGESTWKPAQVPAIVRLLPDYQSDKLLGVSNQGVLEILDDDFVALAPQLPLPPETGGYAAVRARDASGKFRFSAGDYVDATSASLSVGDWSEGQAAWNVIHISAPLTHSLPASNAVVTGEGRTFYRPRDSGIWEIDSATQTVIERVPCTHELFRPSHPDYVACQQDTVLLVSADGNLLAMNAMFEVWQVGVKGQEPTLVIAGKPPNLPPVDGNGFSYYAISPQAPYVAPDGKLWLGFRWGDNTGDDRAYLFSAYPRGGGPWTFLRDDLPKNIQLFGAGSAPLLMDSSGAAGFQLLLVEP